MKDETLKKAISNLPVGRWAIAVSGGADSVALLRLMQSRRDIESIVVHLNHQARGAESDADAAFVKQLADQLNLACHIARRDQIEPAIENLPKNRSAKFRALRLAWFKSVVQSENLLGVVLAHHADDQAETVFSRLLRGSGYMGLAGMSPRATIGGMTIFRPLLGVRREVLRSYLHSIGQIWREDSSNRSTQYARNRIRIALTGHDELIQSLIQWGASCAALRQWVREASPRLSEQFLPSSLARLPAILATESARRWLGERGVPREEILPRIVGELIEMASDAASPHRRDFPGGVGVRRRAGMIFA